MSTLTENSSSGDYDDMLTRYRQARALIGRIRSQTPKTRTISTDAYPTTEQKDLLTFTFWQASIPPLLLENSRQLANGIEKRMEGFVRKAHNIGINIPPNLLSPIANIIAGEALAPRLSAQILLTQYKADHLKNIQPDSTLAAAAMQARLRNSGRPNGGPYSVLKRTQDGNVISFLKLLNQADKESNTFRSSANAPVL